MSAPSPVEIVELAELGAAPADEEPLVVTDEAAPDEESIDIALPPDDAAHAPLLRLVADNTVVAAEPRELAPPAIAASAAAPDSAGAPWHEESAEGGDVTIGDVTLSASLWAILCDEAEQRVATLQHELSLLQFDARQAPTEAMVRASHTLCGIHRTGGFPPIARTSKALEQALIALQQRGAPLPTSAQAVLAGAIDHLAHCVTRVRDRVAFTDRRPRTSRRRHARAGGAAPRRDRRRRRRRRDRGRGGRGSRRAPARGRGPQQIPVDAEPSIRCRCPRCRRTLRRPAACAFVEATEPPVPAMPEPATRRPSHPRPRTSTQPSTRCRRPRCRRTSPRPSSWRSSSAARAGDARACDRRPRARASAEPEPIAAATPVARRPSTPDLRLPAAGLVDPLADIRDDVDAQVLAIFLEEASELYPQAGEQVRGWRRNPRDGVVVQHLRRTLHTFKGSARMAGAMRLGELAHLMESRLMNGDSPVSPTDELFDALDGDLDDVAFVLDALRDGKTNVTLPRFVALPPATAPGGRRGVGRRGTPRRRARPNRRRRKRSTATISRRSNPPRRRCCACAPTSSTAWSTNPAKSRSRARASRASCAR